MTNRNSYMRYRLVPKSSTFGWPWTAVQIFSEFCASWRVWEATTAKRMKIDPHYQRRNCCSLKVLFNDTITLILLGNLANWGRCSELVPIYHGCRALTFALARLSCHSFTDTFSRKLAINLLYIGLIEIPTHMECVATLPCEMLKTEKIAIIKYLFNDKSTNFQRTSRTMS